MLHDILVIAVISAVTIVIRSLPFIVFRDGKEVPETVRYLGEVLPSAVMGMLVVFCLKDLDFISPGHGIRELLSVAVTAVSYLWKRDTSLSVIAGTVCYTIISRI